MSPALAAVVEDTRILSRRRVPDPATADATIVRCTTCGALTIGPCTTPHDRYVP